MFDNEKLELLQVHIFERLDHIKSLNIKGYIDNGDANLQTAKELFNILSEISKLKEL